MEYYPKRIIWHHTGDLSTGHQFDAVNKYHQKKNFPKSQLGWYGGYHYLIEKDGTLGQYKGDFEIGAHTYGHNQNSLGICMSGNFSLEQPTETQTKTFKELMQRLMNEYDITLDNVYMHRDFRPTQCPGLLLTNEWAKKLIKKSVLTLPQRIIISFIRCLIHSLNASRR